MPGLVGIRGDLDGEAIKSQLLRMVQRLTRVEGHKSEFHYENGFGFGRIDIGISIPGSQPVWNESRDICVFMDGELYNHGDLMRLLSGKPQHFKTHSDAEYVLHLHETLGDDFAVHLNGVFAVAIWRTRENKLILANDRLGQRPLYFATYAGRFAFASGVRALLADPDFPRSVDEHAMRQMLSFEYILGNRTLLTEARLLPPASVLTYSGGQVSIRSYWELTYPDTYRIRPTEEFLDGLIHHLRQAVGRQLPGNLSAGINLSGGLDSRMLLGLLSEKSAGKGLRAFTFGVPGCDDILLAREASRAVGVRHTSMIIKPDYLLDLAGEGVWITDGMESCIHMHSMANLGFQAEQVQVLYTGFLMDYLISPIIQREWLGTFDRETMRKLLFDDINTMFKGAAAPDLYTDAFIHHTAGSLENDFNVAADESESANLADWKDKFDFYQRQRRFTKQGDELVRSRVICRTPFNDNDLVDFSLTIPPGLRLHRHIFIEAMIRMFYPLAKVPSDKTGFPLVTCGRGLRIQFDQQLRWRLREYGLNVPERRHVSYVNYAVWFRNELRHWLEDVLLSRRALERGYFKEAGLRRLVSSHMNGEDYSQELGVFLSLELWHRQFIDGDW